MAGFNPNYKLPAISSNWLAGVADETPISNIAYMGSHNSAAWMNARNELWYQVQNQSEKDLSAQFAAGNRSFSLRFAKPGRLANLLNPWNDGSVLQADHNGYNLNSVLPDLAKQLVRALATNPSEFIKVSLDIYEDSTGIENYRQGQDFFSQFLEPVVNADGSINMNKQDGSPNYDPWRNSKSKVWSQEIFDRFGLNDLPQAQKNQLLGKPMVWNPLAEKKYLKDPKTGRDVLKKDGTKVVINAYAIPTVGDVRGKFIFQIPWMSNGLPSDPTSEEFQLINKYYPGTLQKRNDTIYYPEVLKNIPDKTSDVYKLFESKKKNLGNTAWFSPESLRFLDPKLLTKYPKGLFSNRIPQLIISKNQEEQTQPFAYDWTIYGVEGFADDAGRIRDQMSTIIDKTTKWGPEFLGFYGVYASGSWGPVNTRKKEADVVYNQNGLKQALSRAGSNVKGEFFGDYVAWDKDNFDIPAAYVADKSPSIDVFLRQSSRSQVAGNPSRPYQLVGYCDDPIIGSSSAIKIQIKSLDPANRSPFLNLALDPVTKAYKVPIETATKLISGQPFEFRQKSGQELVLNPEYKADSFMLVSYNSYSNGALRDQYGAPRLYSFGKPSGIFGSLLPSVRDLA